jgi:hypothetical protein
MIARYGTTPETLPLGRFSSGGNKERVRLFGRAGRLPLYGVYAGAEANLARKNN